jgi:hypothetical protein
MGKEPPRLDNREKKLHNGEKRRGERNIRAKEAAGEKERRQENPSRRPVLTTIVLENIPAFDVLTFI